MLKAHVNVSVQCTWADFKASPPPPAPYLPALFSGQLLQKAKHTRHTQVGAGCNHAATVRSKEGSVMSLLLHNLFETVRARLCHMASLQIRIVSLCTEQTSTN